MYVNGHFVQKLLRRHTDTHGEPIALPGPLKYTAKRLLEV